jgi:hypothetical protein
MATVIEREREVPVERRVVVERDTDSGAGWAVALVIILALIAIAAFAYFRYYRGSAAPNTINVSVPSVTVPTPTAPAPTSGGTSGAPAGSVTQ